MNAQATPTSIKFVNKTSLPVAVGNNKENLWKCGTGSGRKDHPDFGRYVPRDAFKAFCSAAPYAYWHIEGFGLLTREIGHGTNSFQTYHHSIKRDGIYSKQSYFYLVNL